MHNDNGMKKDVTIISEESAGTIKETIAAAVKEKSTSEETVLEAITDTMASAVGQMKWSTHKW